MTATVIGRDPGELTVKLTTGADFEAELVYQVNGVTTSWPGGTVLTILFEGGIVFTATIAAATATFAVDKAIVDTVPLVGNARVIYTNGTIDRVLFLGRGYRRG